ncbi:hypothetical protein CONPUDRAFT_66633 [Coniophora puteana RWD-64-598 SS2]|uniref:Uncharacterized protein n=1 Tax=Coniophora puteana (strain RWD-64-598) TaxID=741705 RepID=A0A5M3M7V4_CONPW|nr:uncharacterized protein CONPUDRAFT_66633 [Coniophora puteana RWD-64-598 SS2]EIW74875.1 hypothetical protein CONPUDRAFT_66633 [Coniophora puteana RWD-64-598 SS2]
MQRQVRKHAAKLLNRSDKDSPFKEPSVPEVVAFERRKEGGPTAKNFRLQLQKANASQWNKQAIRVFTKDFRGCSWHANAGYGKVKRTFEVHMQALREQYKVIKRKSYDRLQVPSESQAVEEQAHRDAITEANRGQRRRSLCGRRGDACDDHPDLKEFKPLFNQLPPEAMSDDETDEEEDDGRPRYIIRVPAWRSKQATAWLRVFDRIHLSGRFWPNGKPKRGRFPHHRVPSQRVESPGKPVRCLPVNFYDAGWLEGLSSPERDYLKCGPPAKLSHTTRVVQ